MPIRRATAAHDLKPLDFQTLLKNSTQENGFDGGLTTTNPRHIAIDSGAASSAGDPASDDQVSTTGNTVSLEDEMIKVSDTQAQYQAATNLYSKACRLMRTAIGKPGG